VTAAPASNRQAATDLQAAIDRQERNRRAQVAAALTAKTAALLPPRSQQQPTPPRCVHELLPQLNPRPCGCGTPSAVPADDDT